MISRVQTIAFNGLEILNVDLQVQLSSGLPAFNVVGLPDKVVAESKERVRSALLSLGLSLPAKRITINLSPADILKEGSHFDLPIALGLLCSMGVISQEDIIDYVVLGELGLDGSIISVNGILPVSVFANRTDKGIICPQNQGSEAVWSGLKTIIAAPDLLSLINHLKGVQYLPYPVAKQKAPKVSLLDMSDIKGQESAKRALEVAAAGFHNVLMSGPPGAGKSMLASRMPSILPPLTVKEALETSMIHSIAGELKNGELSFERPYRDPHHSASTPALVGGGRKATPGEISLAHNGVLFLDELPEFSRATLDALRQPLENGYVSVSRVNARTQYPAKFQLIAAMNPCKCGYFGTQGSECSRAPKCAEEYQAKISGPLLDRIDIQIEVPALTPWEISDSGRRETSAQVRQRVIKAREIQRKRFIDAGYPELLTNSQLKGDLLEEMTEMTPEAKETLLSFADRVHLSARAYHRTLRLARTIADLQNENKIYNMHIAEALSYRKTSPQKNK